MLSNYTTSTLFSFYLKPQGYAFWHKKFLGKFPTYNRKLLCYPITLRVRYSVFISNRRGMPLGIRNFLGNFRHTIEDCNVIQLHYEYVFFKFYFDKRAEKLFFKAYLYFTLFCFLFASDYGIIFSKSSKKFSSGRFCFPKKDKLCRKR